MDDELTNDEKLDVLISTVIRIQDSLQDILSILDNMKNPMIEKHTIDPDSTDEMYSLS